MGRDRHRLDLSDEEFDALAPEPGTFARTTWQELRAGRPLARAESERDRLAQEHDELLAEFHEYAEHQSWRCGHAPHYYLVGGEALESCPCGLDEVLARFPLATEKAEQVSETAAREAVDGA